MGERRETRELDRRIRARWREWTDAVERPLPLLRRAEGWLAQGERRGLRDKLGRREIASDVRVRPVPGDLEGEMNSVAPQAILRDLHRPETQFGISGLDQIPLGWDRGAAQAVGEVRELIAKEYRIPIDTLITTKGMIVDDLKELSSIKALDWTQAPKMGSGATTTEDLPEPVPSIQEEMRGWRK
jgi:hypothetical protein